MKSLIYNEKRAQQVNPFSSLKCLIFVMLASTNEALRDAQTTYTVLISNIKLVFAYWPLPDIGQIALSGTFPPLPFDYKDDFLAGSPSLNRLPLLQSQLPTALLPTALQSNRNFLRPLMLLQLSEKLFTNKSEKLLTNKSGKPSTRTTSEKLCKQHSYIV
ncbi:hypothetical protein [Acidithiobacillus thiooxidans]|uniref:hypothetical protein n=1 Tax=Acidithiobacillus thiooxidans TaxID=930 RepID=UPI00242C456A|nr:hypothetical protein [Acidithiobacillus thiooxidans]